MLYRWKYTGKLFSYVEAYYELSLVGEHKGIRQLHHDSKNKKAKCQTTFDETYFSVTFSENSNGVASTIICTFSRNKQDKCLSIHQFHIHIPEKTKHHSGDIRYEASKWCGVNLWWIFGMQLIGGGGRESTQLLGMLNIPWQV